PRGEGGRRSIPALVRASRRRACCLDSPAPPRKRRPASQHAPRPMRGRRPKPIIGQIEAMDAGKIPAQAEGDVQNCVDTLRYFNQMAQYTQRRNALAVSGYEAWTLRQPWGPCGFIFPWNFPV